MSEHSLSRSTIATIWRGLLSARFSFRRLSSPRWVEEEQGEEEEKEEEEESSRPPARYDTARFFDDR